MNTFMQRMTEMFDLVLYTAGERSYAEAMKSLIDPKGKYIKMLLARENCVKINEKVN